MDPTPDATETTRRSLLAAAGAITATALAGCNGTDLNTPTASSADDVTATDATDTSPTGMTATDAPNTTSTDTATPEPVGDDVPLLNYALTLEHLENAFYREGLNTYSDEELMGADALSTFGEEVRMQVPSYLRTVGNHEAAHVSAISDTIGQLNGTPVSEGTYDFGYSTPSEFLGVAKALENTGVTAYAGAAPMIVNNEILGAAAGIHSVEARHAAFLNLLDDTSPFPKAVDEATSISEVLEIAGGFISSDVDPSVYELDENRDPHDRKADDDTSDVDVLNYALTLEHLENAFYREGLNTYSDEELMGADALSTFGDHVRMQVPDHLRVVGDHEAAHVTAITDTINDLGGTPVSEANYDFGYSTPSEFLGVAKALENTGVAAYKGAAPTVSNDDVFAAAIGIHSVEARHASFLNELNGTSPFPNGVDKPKTMDEVTEIAGQFIVEE